MSSSGFSNNCGCFNFNLSLFLTGLIGSVALSIGAFTCGLFAERWRVRADLADVISPVADMIDGPIKSTNQVQTISKHGYPSFDSIRSYPNFVISYDRRTRVANWVLEHVTRDHLNSDHYDRSDINFFEDHSFHNYFRATNSDYKNSGYDRGHLAAAGNYRTSPDYLRNTYILSNIAPQVGRGFNRDKWCHLEKYCRSRVHKTKQAWICTGPLYLPQRDSTTGKLFVKYEVIGKNHISVPTHFFKVLLYELDGKFHMECFLMPNQPLPDERKVKDFRVDPEVIERAAGLIFFSHIPRKNIFINAS